MGILAFQKPDKVVMLNKDDKCGQFEFRPLEPGYGITIGNALRRILLSSLEGHAITSIKIEGVEHEFATIEGVKEDVAEIILQLKQVRFRKVVEDIDEETATLVVSGSTQITAKDLGEVLSGFEILNPELVICNLNPDVTFRMEFHVNKGRGYVSADENRKNLKSLDVNVIAIDSIYTPIRNVKYSVENYRIEQKTDYEKLVFEIITDGSILPKDALREAADILIHYFSLFSEERILLEATKDPHEDDFNEEMLHMRQLLKKKLADMDLSVRALNCLKAADIETLGDLVKHHKTDLLKFRNFGRKSLTELEELLEKNDLNFGMDVTKYKLDKD